MSKSFFILFIISLVVFVIAILGINILIKSYEKETMGARPGSQIEEQAVTQIKPVEKEVMPEPQAEELEREAPIQTGEPLVN